MMPTTFDQSRLRWALFGTMLLLALAGSVVSRQDVGGAAAFEVNSTGDAGDANPGDGVCGTGYDLCTLRAAVQEANALAGLDLITFAPSLSLPATVILTDEISISDDVTIRGPSWGVLTLDAYHNSRHFLVTGSMYDPPLTVDISNLTLVNGNRSFSGGGSILVSHPATVTLSYMTFLTNTAEVGGAIFMGTQGSLAISNSSFEDNTTTSNGGAIYATCDRVTITNSNLDGNEALGDGGAIFFGAGTYWYISGSQVTDNHADSNGGALYVDYQSVGSHSSRTESRDQVHETVAAVGTNLYAANTAGGNGGAIYIEDGPMWAKDDIFRDNTAADGGAVYILRSSVSFTNTTFSGNTATSDDPYDLAIGGAIAQLASVITMTNSTFDNNEAASGGALFTGSDISDQCGKATVNRSLFSNNHAQNEGGAIRVDGGYYCRNSVWIMNSTLSGNHADSAGGGIYIHGIDVEVHVNSSTLTANHSNRTGGGLQYGTSGCVDCRSARNEASPGLLDPILTIANSIIAGNTASAGPSSGDCYSASPGWPVDSLGHNLTGAGTSTNCAFSPSSSDVITDTNLIIPAMLSPTLADNGGPTLTHALPPGSQAIDWIAPGVNGCGATITVDQRGVPRPMGPRCDIGAYEAALASISVTKTVGLDQRACATTDDLEVGSGTMVYYCVTIANTGNVTLNTHTIDDPMLWNTPVTLQIVIAPGATVSITTAELPGLGPVVVNHTQSNSVSVTSSDPAFVVPVSTTSFATALVRTVEMTTTWSQVVDPQCCRATRTFTVDVDGSYGTTYYVGFRVTGGTVRPAEFKPVYGSGRVSFTYVSTAPQANPSQTHTPAARDLVEVWVDLNQNRVPDRNFEPYWALDLPTAITLASFTAEPGGPGTVHLDWQTAVEIDSAGFNLHRATAPDGPYTRINPSLIAAVGVGGGASYSYVDAPPRPGTYFYKLEEVDVNGVNTLHGPVSVDLLASWTRTYLPTILR